MLPLANMVRIVGIDEVGRGCWAGPLVSAAVLLHKPVMGLTDSKLLSRAERERLSILIYDNAEIGIGWVSPAEIDEIGLTAATRQAMQNALGAIKSEYDSIIVDGNLNFLAENPKSQTVIKADLTIPVVSAASIIAKVARDQYMYDAAVWHPQYGFDKHVGYGTKFHIEMLKLYGACELHRMSYKPLLALRTAHV